MEVTDTFHELICPQVYEEMHAVTERLIGIHMEELRGKRSFTEVAGDFLKWCGTDFMFGTLGAAGSDGAAEEHAVLRNGASRQRTGEVL